jgi:AcrR family transcriptional regulator
MSRRAYSSKVRDEQAGETRARVIAAARLAFTEDGWQKATIAAVARRAGVSGETIYATFGNKPQLLLAVVQATARRGDTDVAVVEQAGAAAVFAAPDQRTALRLFTRDVANLLAGVAPLVAVVREVARAEPEVDRVYRIIHAGRRENFRRVAAALAGKGPLRPGVDEVQAIDQIWRLASPELFLLMTRVEGLNETQYAGWLEASLSRLLLPD